MRCPKCGQDIANDSNFCEYCGVKVMVSKSRKLRWIVFAVVLLLCVIGWHCCYREIQLKSIFKDSILKPVFNPAQTIALYAKAVEDNDFQFVLHAFAVNVRRYFNLNNISNTEVMKMHQQYDRRYGVKAKHVNIRWDTWETKQLPNGELLVTFIEDFSLERIDSTKQTDFKLYYNIIFDKEGKIISCYSKELR